MLSAVSVSSVEGHDGGDDSVDCLGGFGSIGFDVSDRAQQRWRQDQARLRDGAPGHTPARQVPPVWRAPEGPAAVPVGGGGA